MRDINTPARRSVVTVLGAAAVLIATAAVVWAMRVMADPVPEPPDPGPVTVQVVKGTVEDSSQYSAVIEREILTPVSNRAVGTLTAFPVETVLRVSAGDQVYEVDERPVTVARGTVPMYRDIALGAEGEDVRQTQQLLIDQGYLGGVVDGVAGQRFVAAVRAWQRSLGIDDTGIVGIGDIVFISQLPVDVALDPEHSVGAILVGGEPLLTPVAHETTTSVVVPETESAQVAPGAAVIVVVGEHKFEGVIADRETTESGNVRIRMTSPDGSTLCDLECAAGLEELSTAVLATVIRVPQTSGLTVPVTALWTSEAGEVSVRPVEGDPIGVAIIASAKGIAVVEGQGLTEGTDLVVAQGASG